MPRKTIKEMLEDPRPGDYWSEFHGPSLFVADVKDSGSLVVISDWLSRGGHHPDYSKAREVSRDAFLELLAHTTKPGFVGRGYRGREITLLWVDIWRNEYRGHYALDLGGDNDEDHSDFYQNRWTTVH
jgi:hypothetical protein